MAGAPVVPEGEKFDASFEEYRSISQLVDLAVRFHHPAIRIQIARLKQVLAKFSLAPDFDYPQLQPLYKAFLHMSRHLEEHMVHEEVKVFRYLIEKERMEAPGGAALSQRDNVPPAVVGEYDTAEGDWEKIREMTSGFHFPEELRQRFLPLSLGLQELDSLLREHFEMETQRLYRIAAEKGWLTRG